MARGMSKKDQREKKIREGRARRKADGEAEHDRLIERLARMPWDERVEYMRTYSRDGLHFGRLLFETNLQVEHNRFRAASEEARSRNEARRETKLHLDREWREKQDRAPHVDDSDPEANLEAIMLKAQEFDASYVPPLYDEAPPAADHVPLDEQPLPPYSHEPELQSYGSRVSDPLWIQRLASQRRAAAQAEREAWTNRLAAEQEAVRAAREAQTIARRAEQDLKRGAMKRARTHAAVVLSRISSQAMASAAELGEDPAQQRLTTISRPHCAVVAQKPTD